MRFYLLFWNVVVPIRRHSMVKRISHMEIRIFVTVAHTLYALLFPHARGSGTLSANFINLLSIFPNSSPDALNFVNAKTFLILVQCTINTTKIQNV